MYGINTRRPALTPGEWRSVLRMGLMTRMDRLEDNIEQCIEAMLICPDGPGQHRWSQDALHWCKELVPVYCALADSWKLDIRAPKEMWVGGPFMDIDAEEV